MAAAVIRAMSIADFEGVHALWQRSEGVGLNESDTRENIDRYLQRNPGMSFVACDAAGVILGAVLCGHDGRRGYLHHLAVDAARRRQGIARALLQACFDALRAQHIPKCNIFVFAHNEEGQSFWKHEGWNVREDLRVLQRNV